MTESPFGIRLACLDMAMKYHNGTAMPKPQAEKSILTMAAKFYNFINGDFTEIPELRDQIKLIDKPSGNLSKKTVSFVPSKTEMTVSIDLSDSEQAISDLRGIIENIESQKEVRDIKKLAGIYSQDNSEDTSNADMKIPEMLKTAAGIHKGDGGDAHLKDADVGIPKKLAEFVEPLLKDRNDHETQEFHLKMHDILATVEYGENVLGVGETLTGDYTIAAVAYLAWCAAEGRSVCIVPFDQSADVVVKATLRALQGNASLAAALSCKDTIIVSMKADLRPTILMVMEDRDCFRFTRK